MQKKAYYYEPMLAYVKDNILQKIDLRVIM